LISADQVTTWAEPDARADAVARALLDLDLPQANGARFTEATRHPVFVGYGLTETAPVLTSTLVSPVPKAGSIGRPIPGVELRLVGAVKAYVVRRSPVTADELLRYCEQRLARFKCPTAVEFVTELPRSAIAKVRRAALRQDGPMARLTLITRPGCHLCEEAVEAIRRIDAQTRVGWVEVDVTSDVELEKEYGDRVPVILLDGKEHGYWRVEEKRLLRDLGSAS
jgi:glutaredoxin